MESDGERRCCNEGSGTYLPFMLMACGSQSSVPSESSFSVLAWRSRFEGRLDIIGRMDQQLDSGSKNRLCSYCKRAREVQAGKSGQCLLR